MIFVADDLRDIVNQIQSGVRITYNDALYLYEKANLPLLGYLANTIREKRHGHKTYFNRNIHLEPTNLCIFHCKFCSYSRTLREHEQGWFMNADQMLEAVKKHDNKPITEVHIVGGVHPKLTLDFFCEAIKKIKNHRSELHIKAFTAVELEYMIRKAKLSYSEGLQQLKAAGLDSIPGGGAEIFDEAIRAKICHDKCSSQQWLDIHAAAHDLNIPSNVTMLYGHYENYEHRIDHMNRVRDLQDKHPGFNAFIPLKFRNENNEMSHLAESTIIEDLKVYAISRIFLDNIDHIKAYWPMIGRETAQLSLAFGVDDIDGTIDDTTKIYAMAGSEEQNPTLSTQQLVQLIKQVHRIPIERDTIYNTIQDYSDFDFNHDNNFISLPKLN